MKPSITSKEEVSRGQKDSCITLVSDATRKATGVAIDELVANGVLNKKNIQRVLSRGHEVVSSITELVKQKFAEIAENIVDRVKLFSGAATIEIEATDGSETIGTAKDVFTGYLDNAFKKRKCDAAPMTRAQVYEMIKDGTYAQIFGGMSDDLNKLCLTEHQIKRFVQNHRKWLRDEGYGTFFLYKEDDEFFVANVGLNSGGPGVNRDPLSSDCVWHAESRPRLVVPQLTLEN